LKLQFDIVFDILSTKKEIMDVAADTAEIKKHNNRILELIADKKDDDLKGKSINELEKMLR